MIFIGENIHIMSKSVRTALVNRDDKFIRNLLKTFDKIDYIDLNVGPAKNELQGILFWLASVIKEETHWGISFDTSNADEMREGLEAFKGNTFINSANYGEPRFSQMSDLALEFDSNLIALTLNSGIPKTADDRLELAFEMYERLIEKGINNGKLYFDPLILPVCADQTQGLQALNTIKMIKESFDPPVKTIIGLSNISNGCPQKLRPVINRIYAVLAFGAGMDAIIADAKDKELIRILRMLEKNTPESQLDKLYISLSSMIKDFAQINEISYDVNNSEQALAVKTAGILLGNEIYSHSFAQI